MAQQPIQVHCEDCVCSFITPDENRQIRILPKHHVINAPSYILKLDGTATLIIHRYQLKGSSNFFELNVTVTYYQYNKVIGGLAGDCP
jgi:hypothetical protein